jgi:hypothetical protein
MFEAKPPRVAEAHPCEESLDGDVLRTLSWADLVTRLAAARELRAAFDGTSAASFDAGSARRIAAHHSGKHSINHDASSNGKCPRGTGGVSRN